MYDLMCIPLRVCILFFENFHSYLPLYNIIAALYIKSTKKSIEIFFFVVYYIVEEGEFMLYDCHMHTTNSDGVNSVNEMCISAIEKGMEGITITDHADMNFYMERDTLNRIKASISQSQKAREEFSDKLKVFRGVELGEYTYSPQKAREILSLDSFDAVLCSVHLVPKAGYSCPYNRIDFTSLSEEELKEYLKFYFDLLSETIDSFDFDILSHIQCPIRYMSAKYKRKTDVMFFKDKISEILEKIIKRNIALEVNTDVYDEDFRVFNLNIEEILSLYKSLGGKLVTLGSDAHSISDIGRNFEASVDIFKRCGFDKCVYFENRTKKEYQIKNEG